MTVPGRVEAAALLLSLDPPAWFLRHSRAVAEVAAWLAARAARRDSGSVDRHLVEAAALLHDADKALPTTDPARSLPHGEGSAAWLARHGLADLGPAVIGHPITFLAGPRGEDWLEHAEPEALLVSFADKRARQRLVSLDDRFADWTRRYPEERTPAEVAIARDRAVRLSAIVCDLAAVAPHEVRRLRWTGAALRMAQGRP